MRTLYCLLLLLISAVPASPQLVFADLSGLITDTSGSAIPGAQIEALRVAGGQARTTTASTKGEWSLPQLTPGLYKLTLKAPGFATKEISDLDLPANRSTRLDVTLTVANASETVTVSASGDAAQTDSGTRSQELTASQVLDLPVGGQRNFQNLIRLVPGATPPKAQNSLAGNPQSSLVANFNGVSYAQNGNRLDGALNYFVALPHHAAYIPPAEAIEAVSIQTNAFDAEQGLAGGAALNVSVRTGGNAFHGGVWEFHTNSALRARNFFYYGNLPKNILNQFGARLGGPIRKNRLFFYGDYEGNRNRQAANILASVPTAPMRQGDFSATGATIYDPSTGLTSGASRTPFVNNQIPASRFSSAAAQMAALIPTQTQAGFNNNYFASGSLKADRDNYDIKVNSYATSRLSLFGRYGTFSATIFDPPTLGAAGGPGITSVQPGNATNTTHSATGGATYSYSPTLVFDTYFGFTRQKSSGENVDINKNYGLDVLKIPGTNGPNPLEGGYPGFSVSGYTTFGNPNVSNPYQWADNLYVWAGNASWIHSSHNVRAGVEITRAEINHFQPQGSYSLRGSFTFTGGLTALAGSTPNLFNAWGDFLLGLPQSFGKTTATVIPSSVRTNTYAFYLRDQWRVTSRLTLTYGFRYERYPFSQRPDRGLERYDPSTTTVLIGGLGSVPTNTGVDVGPGQFAPRFGFAYRATNTFVLRGGYGISVDPFSYGVFMRNVYPVVIGVQYNGPNTYQNAGTLLTGIPAIVTPSLGNGVISIPNNVATNTVPSNFRRGYIESFNLTLEKQLPGQILASAAYVGTRSIRQIAQVNINASFPGGGDAGRALAQLYGRTADTTELLPLGTANYNSLQSTLKRSLRHGIQFQSSYTFSKVIALNDNADSNLFFSSPAALLRNRAVTGYDRTHAFSLAGSAELPFGKGKSFLRSGPLATILGGWQLGAVSTAYSGLPFTVTASGTQLNAPGNSQTADQILTTVAMPRIAGTTGSWFDPNAFQSVTGARFGTSGLNILRGPAMLNTDVSLLRQFRFRERFEAQFRLEAFNLTNTPAFNNPNANVSSATTKSLNGYSQITSALSTERQLRFALRLNF